VKDPDAFSRLNCCPKCRIFLVGQSSPQGETRYIAAVVEDDETAKVSESEEEAAS
jgi:hypothetical protein